MPSLGRASVVVFLAAMAIAAHCLAHAPHAFSGEPENPAYSERERRELDQLALSSKKNAIGVLASLVREHRDQSDEAELLLNYAEALQSAASIEYRLAHADKAKKPELAGYHDLMLQSYAPVDRYINHYPKAPEQARAYYLRAKSLVDRKLHLKAIEDLKTIVTRYPGSRESEAGKMTLCDLLIELRDYPQAVYYLQQIERKPPDNTYPLILDRLAWVHFNMGNLRGALEYCEKGLAYYRKRAGGDKTYAAEREKLMITAVEFYVSGYETRKAEFDIQQAVPFLKRQEAGPAYPKALVRLAYLLRTKGMNDELELLQPYTQSGELGPTESAELYAVIFENQVQQRRFAQLGQAVAKMSRIYARLPAEARKDSKFQRSLLFAIKTFETDLVKDGKSKESREAGATLKALLQLLLQADPDPVAQTKVHLNLAGLALKLQDFETAVQEYLWLEKNGRAEKGKRSPAENARQDAIAARYESLKSRGLFPTQLTPVSWAADSTKPVAPEAAEWIRWLDETKAPMIGRIPTDALRFEANRLLYHQGKVKDAAARLWNFVRNSSQSEFAIPSASLLIDTYVATGDWEATSLLAERILKVAPWKDPVFRKRAVQVAGDSYFKVLELAYKNKDYKKALERSKFFLANYKDNAHFGECLALAASSALALNDKQQALAYFEQLKQGKALKPELQGTYLLTRGAEAEAAYDFDGARRAYFTYLSQSAPVIKSASEEVRNLRQKVLLYSWISNEKSEAVKLLSSPVLCTADLREECAEYRSLVELAAARPSIPRAAETKGAVASALALGAIATLQPAEIYALVSGISSDWDRQSGLVKYTLLPRLSAGLPDVFRQLRMRITQSQPLKLQKQVIAARAKQMQEMEKSATEALKLPWIAIRAGVLNELAGLYADFCRELDTMAKPPGLAGPQLAAYNGALEEVKAPFLKKRNDYRLQAFELASEAGESARVVGPIAQAYFAENPEAATRLQHPLENRVAIANDLLTQFEGQSPGVETSRTTDALKSALMNALQGTHWPRIAFLMQEAKAKETGTDAYVKVAEALSLAKAGALAEALVKLAEAKEQVSVQQKSALLTLLASNHYGSYSTDKTSQWLEELAGLPAAESNPPSWIASARSWSGTKSVDASSPRRLPAGEKK